jgi:hypothetical protein
LYYIHHPISSFSLHLKVPIELWAEAANYSNYIRNRVLSSTGTVTPYEIWFGKKPDLSHLRVFGSQAFIHIPDERRKKLDEKSMEGILVGYCDTSKAYRVWDPVTRKVKISRDIRINEGAIPETTQSAPELEDPVTFLRFMLPTSHIQNQEPVHEIPQVEEPDNPPVEVPNINVPVCDAVQNDEQPEAVEIENEPAASEPRSTTKKMLEPTRHSRRIENQKRGVSLMSLEQYSDDPDEPTNYNDALSSQEGILWKKAVDEEYSSLIENGTWTLVPLPSNQVPIKCKWVFKIKPGHNYVAARYKARLVAKGYSQRKGIDYKETFAPVVKHTSLRLILAIASKEDLDMLQLDIKTAFLYGDLEEDLYMEQPEGYLDENKSNYVCKLKKCIYGLKQAPRAWHQKFNAFLLKFGLTQSAADPCILFRHQQGEITIVAIYVDDGLVMSNKKHLLTEMTEYLGTHFQIRCLPADRFIGLDITRDRCQRKIYLSQHHLITKVLKRYSSSSFFYV